jgi:hypothetical protein
MAKVIVAWCDPCMNNEEHTPGNPFVVSLGVTMKPKEIDLCETHEKELLTPLRELLGEVGQPVGEGILPGMPATPASDAEKKDCPQCPPGRTLTREGLRGHMRKIHGMDRTAANDVVRDTFGGNARVQKPFSEQCPECKAAGVPVDESTYDTPQGFGAHRKAAHGVIGSGRTE